MSQGTWPDGPHADLADLADLAGRRDALRQAAAMPGADPRVLLDAAFAELDAAMEALAKLAAEPAPSDAGAGTALGAEAGLLREVFRNAPAPLFVLEADGTIRRANGKAGELIGVPPGYASGRPLTAFVDLPSRAALASQLAAAMRTGAPRRTDCRLLGPAGPAGATLTANAVTLPEGPRLLVVTVTEPAGAGTEPGGTSATGGGGPDGGGAAGRDRASGRDSASGAAALQTMTRRMDLVTAVTRLLLDNSTFSEAVTLQRCARLLAGDIASWVIVDVERSGRLRRQFVIGPPGELAGEQARTARAVDPLDVTLPAQVHAAGRSAVLAHADDAGLLGTAPDGTPLVALLGVTSLLSVPICDEGTGYGVLTLARQAAEGRFEIADLGLAEELGEHLGVAIRVDRMFRRRSEVAEALQSSLLPARLPEVPGLVDVLSGGGLPLGLFPDAEPERETLELDPGDLLFFYSDGVTEARNADMQYFEDRLADELAGMAGRSAAETTRMIQGLVSSFSDDQLRDDMTILVAKVTP